MPARAWIASGLVAVMFWPAACGLPAPRSHWDTEPLVAPSESQEQKEVLERCVIEKHLEKAPYHAALEAGASLGLFTALDRKPHKVPSEELMLAYARFVSLKHSDSHECARAFGEETIRLGEGQYGEDSYVTASLAGHVADQRNLRELQEDLSVVRLGATREQIEGVLGDPDESESDDDATVHVYRHQRGSANVVMYVTYGPDGTVARAETAAQHDEEERKEKRRRDTEDLLAKAQCGDAHAQSDLGYRYITGQGVAQDLARAYFWFGIAHTGGVGFPPRERPSLSKRITPEQIAEAERLMAEWEPKDCTAEKMASPSD